MLDSDKKNNRPGNLPKIKIVPKNLPGPSQISTPEGPSPNEHRGLYVDKKKRRLPSWLLAAIIVLVLLIGIFWILPRVFTQNSGESTPLPTVAADEPAFREDVLVVTDNSCWLVKEPRRGADRIAQLLFNEELELLDSSGEHFLLVRTKNGQQGYIARASVSADSSGLDTSKALLKVIIRTPYKNIMSHTQGGTVIAKAPLGSVLYADYQDTQVLKIRLPGGNQGWISKNDVFILEPAENLPRPEDTEAALISAALTFDRATWVPRGLTTAGIDMAGVLYLSCMMSGIEVQHRPEAIAELGDKLNLPINADTGSYDLRYANVGDILVLDEGAQIGDGVDFALIMPNNQIMLHRIGGSSISVVSLSSRSLAIEDRMIEVRRLNIKKDS